MDNKSLDNPLPLPPPKPTSRRNFLKLAGIFAGGTALGAGAMELFLKSAATSHESDKNNKDQLSLLTETNTSRNEIIAFRESLGLEGLPAELESGIEKNVSWTTSPDNFSDLLPVKNKSYALHTAEIIQKLFGSNATHLIKGVKFDPEHPIGMSFEGGTRFFNIEDSVHNAIPIHDFIAFVLHEAGGHGSDPSVGASYPPEILIQVEHGKWKALSQAFLVPDQFLNHKYDATLPSLKRSLGESVAYFMNGDKTKPIVDEAGVPVIETIVSKVANNRAQESHNLKFNKKVCKEIGEAVIAQFQKGEIELDGALKNTYQIKMEDGLQEIYAEMFKYALLYPDEIRNNHQIISGIFEVITAIQERVVNLNVIRESIKNPSQEVLIRNAAEEAMILPPDNPEKTTAPTLTAQEQEKNRNQQEEFEKKEKAYQDFANKGEIPNTITFLEGQREAVQLFASLYSRIIQKYPTLKETFDQKGDDNFDPEMHIWEIHEIELAINSGFVRNLINSPTISYDMLNEISSKNLVLEKFINSPAF